MFLSDYVEQMLLKKSGKGRFMLVLMGHIANSIDIEKLEAVGKRMLMSALPDNKEEMNEQKDRKMDKKKC